MNNENNGPNHSVTLSIASTSSSSKWSTSPWGYEISSRFIILASTIFPAVGCYFCIAYTYLFQIHRVINFQSDHCNGTPTALPPVSYSIGIWLPQKFFWLAVLMLHVPPRIIFTNMCQQYYFHAPNNQTSQPSSAYNVILRIHYYFMHSEMWALVGVSVMDIEYNFLIHATFFGIWLGTFNMNMLLNTILHYNSGLMTIGKKYVYIFRFKLFMFVFGCPFSLSSAASYLFYLHTCEDYGKLISLYS
uniref:Serpentine receptor class gamma n=1 Tax=Rhabditophanes sp. KR3021 TaxID=114890 RepID=A0AC35U8Q2_9BILA